MLKLGLLEPSEKNGKKVVICIPLSGAKPFPQCIDALEASAPLLTNAGYDHNLVSRRGPYISHNRGEMLRKAMDAKADIVVFIDQDLSWEPEDLLRLIEHDSDVTSGLYRMKSQTVEFMGAVETDEQDRPQVNPDGSMRGYMVPAGFLKITKKAVHEFMEAYPELCYGPKYRLAVDLFQHGAHNGLWWGEDYRFSRRWRERCGEIHILPDLNLTHWLKTDDGFEPFPGNYHEFMLRQPGGSKEVRHEGKTGKRQAVRCD